MEQTQQLVLSDALLENMRAVVNQRQQLTAMLEQAQQQKAQVTARVFQRVIEDYRQRMAKVDKDYAPLRQEMSAELDKIRVAKQQIAVDLETHRETLEEAHFRHQVGEYSEEDLQSRLQEGEAKLQRLETLMTTANETCTIATELMGDDEDVETPEPSPAGFEPTPPQPAAIPLPLDSLANPLDSGTEAAPDAAAAAATSDAAAPEVPASIEFAEVDEQKPPHLATPEAASAEPATNQVDTPTPGAPRRRPGLGGLFGRSSIAGAFAAAAEPAPDELPDSPEAEASNSGVDAEETALGAIERGQETAVAFPTDGQDEYHTRLATPINQEPLPPGCASLHRQGDDPRQWELSATGLLMGRNPRCDIVINEPMVSRRHAAIIQRNNCYIVEDTSGGGGITVNGQTVSRHQLSNGDTIGVGKQVFTFKETDS
jgi:hypothetical protein